MILVRFNKIVMRKSVKNDKKNKDSITQTADISRKIRNFADKVGFIRYITTNQRIE